MLEGQLFGAYCWFNGFCRDFIISVHVIFFVIRKIPVYGLLPRYVVRKAACQKTRKMVYRKYLSGIRAHSVTTWQLCRQLAILTLSCLCGRYLLSALLSF